jgi:hypothetical protein
VSKSIARRLLKSLAILVGGVLMSGCSGEEKVPLESMEHEETYYGRRIIVTTEQQANGEWKSRAELLDAGGRIPLGERSDERYHSEEAARSAALSAATGAIDATRILKGKP